MIKILVALTLLTTNVFALDDFDLYRYGPDAKIEVERDYFILKMVFYKTEEELQSAYDERMAEKGEEGIEVRAFAMVSKEFDTCFVHIVKPKIWDDRENLTILGHEIYHCTFAQHDEDVVVINSEEPETK